MWTKFSAEEILRGENLRFCLLYHMGGVHIWHAYSPNVALSNDTKVNDLDFDLRAKSSFFRLCCRQGHSVSQTHLGISCYIWYWD